MKNTLLFTLMLFFTGLTSFGQSNFEYGYYIDNAGNKKECEISEISINRFPEKIIVRKNKQIEEIDLTEIKEVKYGTDIFQKKEFQYEPSNGYSIDNLTKDEKFYFIKKGAFVQLLVEGNYNLYLYVANGVSTFIYQNPEGNLITLGYKKYLKDGNNIVENKFYLNQLFENVKNTKYTNLSTYSILKYNAEDLSAYFKEVNGKSYVKVKKSEVRFNIFAGYANHTMDINFISDIPVKNYGHVIVVPEIEYVLNKSLKNPLSFYFNVSLHQFKNDFVEEYVRENWHHKVDYQSLYISLGAKKYFLSNDKVSYYAKLGVGLNNPIKSEILSPIESWILNPILLDRYRAGINAGVGIKLFDAILIEVDYDQVFNTPHINKNTSLNFKVGYTF
ncbi:MAG TPA: hypothetical protein VLY87_04175 [Flavobacterium sp.]|nr:hypothetical protein [Flavobacterium sp.]